MESIEDPLLKKESTRKVHAIVHIRSEKNTESLKNYCIGIVPE